MKLLIASTLIHAAAALVPPGAGNARSCLRSSPPTNWELGERTRVKLVPGAQPKKLRKKQRRSRSPMLYPCETANGEECWLHVPAGQSHLSERTDEIHAYVTEVDVDESEGDILVLSPTRSEQTDRAPVAGPPNGGRLLDKLAKNDPIEGTVLRMLTKDVALVACRGVYRKAASGYRRQAAVLREASDLAVGDTVNCYVRLVEKSSGRLTVSRERVGSLRNERVAARLRKQIKRGTLAPGKQRVATVINYVGDFLQVDAGGILADIDAPDEEDFSEGDRIMVRIESVDEQALTATLSYVSLDQLEEGE